MTTLYYTTAHSCQFLLSMWSTTFYKCNFHSLSINVTVNTQNTGGISVKRCRGQISVRGCVILH